MTYTFKCDTCKSVKELNINMTLIPGTIIYCDVCQRKMSRVWDVPMIQFKGKGFYCNEKRCKKFEK